MTRPFRGVSQVVLRAFVLVSCTTDCLVVTITLKKGGTRGGGGICKRRLVEKPDGRKPLTKPGYRRENNINMNLKGIVFQHGLSMS